MVKNKVIQDLPLSDEKIPNAVKAKKAKVVSNNKLKHDGIQITVNSDEEEELDYDDDMLTEEMSLMGEEELPNDDELAEDKQVK